MQLRTDTIAPALKPCRTILFFFFFKLIKTSMFSYGNSLKLKPEMRSKEGLTNLNVFSTCPSVCNAYKIQHNRNYDR